MTPNGTIYVCKDTNLIMNGSDFDTIYFDTSQHKRDWFTSKVIKTFNEQMYTRMGSATQGRTLGGEQYATLAEGKIRVQCNIGDINMADYLFYLEPSYENRWFYCFITNILYINDSVTEIHFIEDVFMTWCHTMTLGSSFVLRESTATDIKYAELHDQSDFTNDGSLRSYGKYDILKSSSESVYVMLATNVPVNWVTHETLEHYAGVPYGKNQGRLDSLTYYVTKLSSQAGLNNFAMTIKKQQTDNDWNPLSATPAYRVVGVYLVSALALPANVLTWVDAGNIGVMCAGGYSVFQLDMPSVSDYVFDYPSAGKTTTHTIAMSGIESTAFGGYTPKNNKLYSAPYVYLRIKNNWGDCIDLEPQHLEQSSNNAVLNIKGTFGTAESVNLYPNYETEIGNTSLRLHKTEAPQIPYNYNTYEQWLSQNKLGLALSGAQGIINGFATYYGALGTATVPKNKGGGAGFRTYRYQAHQYDATSEALHGYASAGGGIVGALGDMMSVRARGASTAGTGTAGISSRGEDNDCFSYEIMSISATDAEAVDDYLTKYGYAINHIKSVTYGLNNRSRFHYIQTDGAIVKGNVPMYAKEMIKRIFDNGIRIWNKDYFLDYSNGNPLSS